MASLITLFTVLIEGILIIQAKETPEPIFDLSECHLQECPPVFVICKVLRKEVLLLHRNQLSSLRGGGHLIDLSLLRILDLRENKLKTLPDEISELSDLRVSPDYYDTLIQSLIHSFFSLPGTLPLPQHPGPPSQDPA